MVKNLPLSLYDAEVRYVQTACERIFIMTKRIITPDFYRNFRCVGGDCPDTCCKDWDIVVDEQTLSFYKSLDDRTVAEKIKTDEDGDDIIAFENGVCPFFDGDGLCSLQRRYGERGLCSECGAFPRITQDYTTFEERLLTLACPEAARLMITEQDRFDFLTDVWETEDSGEYDPELMDFLIIARAQTAEIFRSGEPFKEKLCAALLFTEEIQSALDDDIFFGGEMCKQIAEKASVSAHGSMKDKRGGSARFIFELHKSLDVMDRSWLDRAVSCDGTNIAGALGGELSSLMLYYIARYYLTAVASYDVITTIKRALCACVVCASLAVCENALDNAQKRELICEKYSKEIEHSDENLDKFTDAFLTEDFTSENLIEKVCAIF